MPVQIIINGENAGEALKELSALASGTTPATNEITISVDEKKLAEAVLKPKEKVEKPKPERPAKAEKPEAPPAEAEDPKEEQSKKPEGKVPDVVELRAKASEVGKTPEGKVKVKELLNKYGFSSISAVPEDQRAEFLADLEALI